MTTAEFIVSTLCTVDEEVGVVDISKLLPPKSMVAMENSVSETSLRVLIQEMVGRERPSAVQLRESGVELRSTTGLTGDTVMEGGTVGRIDYTIGHDIVSQAIASL